MDIRAHFCATYNINDMTAAIESKIRLFADDCVCYRDIKDKEDTLLRHFARKGA